VNGLGKTIAVLVFAGLVGAILLGPVLDPAGQNQGTGDELPSPLPSEPTKPTPQPSPSETPQEKKALRLDSGWPTRCLRRVPEISGDGLVAAYDGTDVTIAMPDGTVTGSFAGAPPLQWSPSGRYVAAGDGEIVTAAGKKTPDFPPVDGEWFAWSPVADCMIFGAHRSLRMVAPGRDEVILLREQVLDLAFSPNGRRLALVIGPRLWIADLETGRLLRARGKDAATKLFAWTPDGSLLLYGVAPGESVAADGIRIRALLMPERIRGIVDLTHTTYLARALDHDDFFEPCGGLVMFVEGSGRDTTRNKHLAVLEPARGTRPVTGAAGPVYLSPACSPGGRYIAAVRAPDGGSIDDRQLVLLSADGSFLDDLTPALTGADEYPSWGPAGVVFVMRPASGPPQVWFIPEGGTARSTGLSVRAPRAMYGHFDWDRVLDWSGDAPSGSPPGV